MRLIRISLQNFAGVVEREVDFNPAGVTVVEGPNESGKTTLLKAFDLLLNTPDSSRAAAVLAVRPEGTAAGPFVEAEFVTDGYQVNYAKRWLSQPETTVAITDPSGRRRTLAGREAHDAVSQLLERTMDRELWRALQVQQGTSLQLPSVGASSSLREALDQAASGQLGGDVEDNLLGRVRTEVSRYYTPSKGTATAELRQAQETLASAQAELGDAQNANARAEGAVTQVIDGERRLQGVRDQQAQVESDVTNAEQAKLQVDGARDRLEEYRRTVDVTKLALSNRRLALERRQQMVTRLAEANEQVTRREEAAAALRETRDALEKEHIQDSGKLAEARAALEDAEAAVRLTEGDVLQATRESELAMLRARLEQARTAESRLREIANDLGAIRVTDENLETIEDLYTAANKAEGQMVAAASRLRIRAERALTLEIDGRSVDLEESETTERTVAGHASMTVPGFLTVDVFSGGKAGQLARKGEEARAALSAALDDAGVGTVVEARAAHQRAATLKVELEAERKVLDGALLGSTPDLLQAHIDDLERAAANHLQTRPNDRPLPVHMQQAQAILTECIEARNATKADVDRQRDILSRLEGEVAKTAALLESSLRELATAHEERTGLEGALEQERAETTDDELESSATQAQVESERTQREYGLAQNDLDALDPDVVAARWDSVNKRKTRLQQEAGDLDRQLTGAIGYLRAIALEGDGPAERLAHAEGEFARAEQSLRTVDARARSASLLFETLMRHRETALQAYREPYRLEVERLGRFVFGRDFAVELDGELRVQRRTLSGVNLPVDRLSSGALEQLGMVMRLACANLVSGEGVPVVLDDAFSFSDETRLSGLCLALDRVGENGQVVLLTCVPDRYQRLGDVTIVRMVNPSPSRLPQVVSQGDPPVEWTAEGPEERVILALRQADGPLGKSPILATAKIAENDWPRVIRALLDSGLVERVGEKRGATYRLPAAH